MSTPAPSSRPDTRYEIGVLVGPCSEPEATALMEEVDEFVDQRLGGITSLVRQQSPDTLTAREHAETVRENAMSLFRDKDGEQWAEAHEITDQASPDLRAARDVLALLAEVERLEGERDKAQADAEYHQRVSADNFTHLKQAAKDARAAEALAAKWEGKRWKEHERAEAAEAEVERLEGVKVAALTYIYARGDDTEAYQALCDAVDHSPPPTAAEIREDGSPVAAYTHFRRRALNAESERDEAYRQAAQADEANVMMGTRLRDVEIALAAAEALSERRAIALRVIENWGCENDDEHAGDFYCDICPSCIARAALAVSPSEPVPQQAEEVTE